MQRKIFLTYIGIFFFLSACWNPSGKQWENEVVIHESTEPDMLNPVTYQNEISNYIESNIFQSLIGLDFKTFEYVPVLAKARPVIEKVIMGGDKKEKILITYEIRPEAKWDNGEPIIAKDAEFSLKVIKNPKVDAARLRTQFSAIEDIRFYDDNPKKFTFVCSQIYLRAEIISGGFNFIPRYIYDMSGLMDSFTFIQLDHPTEELMSNSKINEFAYDFNSSKFQREKEFIVGSGAYELNNWETGRSLVLKRKKNWWGDKLEQVNMFFEAYPKRITYEIITDPITALTALKGNKLDVMYRIPPKDFVNDLFKNDNFKNQFNLFTPVSFAYSIFGINMRQPKFSDKKVRQALAYLVDADKIIDNIYYGLAQKIIGPVNPSKKEYNNEIQPFTHDIEKAKSLLKEAGWKDSDGNGIIDNNIKGKKVEFEVDLLYNTGNLQREAICLIFQEEARKVGIKINLIKLDLSVLSVKQKEHNFDMFCGGFISTPIPFDYKQMWHSVSANGGSNFYYFGKAYSDALIDSIRQESNEDNRIAMSKRMQAVIHDEVPAIFLFSEKERIAISKKFPTAETYSLRPGFWEAGFKME